MFTSSKRSNLSRPLALPALLIALFVSWALADAPKAGIYSPYSEKAAAAPGRTVLFFHAKWCPSCRSADKAFQAEAASLPVDVNLLKVDYDSQSDLKKKYGVTGQTTFVWVDAKGNSLKKWMGSQSVAEVLGQLKKAN